MLTSNADRQIFRKLQAIDSAEHYLIARTHREIRATQAASGTGYSQSRVMLAASAACLTAAVLVMQVWIYLTPVASI